MDIRGMLGVVLLLALVLGVWGCQDEAATTPGTQSGTDQNSAFVKSTDTILPDSLLGVDIKLILPLVGGTLNVRTCSLDIPAGALLAPLTLRFELVSNPPPKGLNDPCDRLFNFGPDLTVFEKTCILTVPFDELALSQRDPSKYACYYYNEARRRFEIQPTTVDMAKRRYLVRIKHFSQYAFGRVDE